MPQKINVQNHMLPSAPLSGREKTAAYCGNRVDPQWGLTAPCWLLVPDRNTSLTLKGLIYVILPMMI